MYRLRFYFYGLILIPVVRFGYYSPYMVLREGAICVGVHEVYLTPDTCMSVFPTPVFTFMDLLFFCYKLKKNIRRHGKIYILHLHNKYLSFTCDFVVVFFMLYPPDVFKKAISLGDIVTLLVPFLHLYSLVPYLSREYP